MREAADRDSLRASSVLLKAGVGSWKDGTLRRRGGKAFVHCRMGGRLLGPHSLHEAASAGCQILEVPWTLRYEAWMSK